MHELSKKLATVMTAASVTLSPVTFAETLTTTLSRAVCRIVIDNPKGNLQIKS
jgi:hypothetical protein